MAEITVPFNADKYRLGVGIDPIQNQLIGSCAFTSTAETKIVPGAEISSSMLLSTSSSTSKKEESLAVSGTYSGWGVNVSASVEAASEHNASAKSVAVSATASYDAGTSSLDLTTVQLNSTAAEILANDPADFLKKYGKFFVSGQHKGGYYLGRFRYDLASTEDKKSVAGKMSAAYSGVEGKGGAKVEAALSEEATKNSLTTSAFQHFDGTSADIPGSNDCASIIDGYTAFCNAAQDDAAAQSNATSLGTIASTWDSVNAVQKILRQSNKNFPEGYPPKGSESIIQEYGAKYIDYKNIIGSINEIENTGVVSGKYNNDYLQYLKNKINNAIAAFDGLKIENLYSPPQEFVDATNTDNASIGRQLVNIGGGSVGMILSYNLSSKFPKETIKSTYLIGKVDQYYPSDGYPGKSKPILTAAHGTAENPLKLEAFIDWSGNTSKCKLHGRWRYESNDSDKFNSYGAEMNVDAQGGHTTVTYPHHTTDNVTLTNATFTPPTS